MKSEETLDRLNQVYIKEYGISNYISQRFSNFFNSYSKSFNMKYNRKGSLFLRPFKRIVIDTDSYFTQMVSYIHRNPIHHGYVQHINEWKHSSYHDTISQGETFILRDEILEWFGGKEAYINFQNEANEDWMRSKEELREI